MMAYREICRLMSGAIPDLGRLQILSQCAGRPAGSCRCKSDTMNE
jgi:hypothetical protein